jgi:hypothetical protein
MTSIIFWYIPVSRKIFAKIEIPYIINKIQTKGLGAQPKR